MLPVVEKFISINGEGAHAGELAAFIRFRGCNLCCSYCDTSWANCETAPAEYETPEDIAEWVAEKGVENVTLTGGEPLLQKECDAVAELLMKQGCRVEIECSLWTISCRQAVWRSLCAGTISVFSVSMIQ